MAQCDWRIGQAQERLKAAGFDAGYIDGVMGRRTREALRRYQTSRDLPATGQLDEATQRLLFVTDCAQTAATDAQEARLKGPPGGDYKKLSAIAQLPDYLPGLGMLYVDPRAMPVGPFLAYDRQGRLVSTVYMVPLRDLRAGEAFNGLAGPKAPVDQVDMYYNHRHAGVPDPHYHIVLWYISSEQVKALQ